jgi:hypothetical protein
MQRPAIQLAIIALLSLVCFGASGGSPETGKLPADPTPPPGFRLVLSAPGVWLYQKDYANGRPDFVQVIDFSQGAGVELLHGPVGASRGSTGMYGGPNPIITRQPLEAFWGQFTQTHPSAFCLVNGQFFRLTNELDTQLAFPLKKDGAVLSEGYGKNEYKGEKLIWEIWPERSSISPLSQESLYQSNAPDLLAGLTEIANKRAKKLTGRTFIGVDDRNKDGRFETALIFSTQIALQVNAAEVLRQFGADQIMMLDGGGSAQLICQGTPYVPSDRPVPQAVGVFAGAVNPSPAGEPALEPGESEPKDLEAGSPQSQPSEDAMMASASVAAVPAESSLDGNRLAAEALRLIQPYLTPTETLSLNDSLWVPITMMPVAALLLLLILRSRSGSEN